MSISCVGIIKVNLNRNHKSCIRSEKTIQKSYVTKPVTKIINSKSKQIIIKSFSQVIKIKHLHYEQNIANINLDQKYETSSWVKNIKGQQTNSIIAFGGKKGN